MLCLNSVFRKQGKGQEKDRQLICEKMLGTVRAPFGHKPKKRTCAFTQVLDIHGAPERIRTSDLCLRRAALYPAELRAHSKPRVARQFRVRNLTCAGGVCPAPELNSSLRFSAFSVRE